MKLLFDENLSRQLCHRLADCFPNAVHVSDLNLTNVDDREIWDYARKENLIIVSKDGDFHDLSFLLGAPPKVIWLRLGNCTTTQAETTLRQNLSIIKQLASDPDATLLLLDG